MDRACIFIDVGYLMAEAGALCCATKRRSQIFCNSKTLTEALVAHCALHCALPILRTYWYDAARDGLPTKEQLRIGDLPNVKLRLGRLVQQKKDQTVQKGVDALIYRDLMVLARERAMATAYLLAGDEDLREGVSTAQDMGVRVVLLGIASTTPRSNQSAHLIREADEHVILPKGFWAEHVRPVDTIPGDTLFADVGTASKAGRDFADSWAAAATPDEIKLLLAQKPDVPREIDGDLMRHAAEILGEVWRRRDLRTEMRQSFWDRLAELSAVEVVPTSGDGDSDSSDGATPPDAPTEADPTSA